MTWGKGRGENPRRNLYEKPHSLGPLDNDHWRCSCSECVQLARLREKEMIQRGVG